MMAMVTMVAVMTSVPGSRHRQRQMSTAMPACTCTMAAVTMSARPGLRSRSNQRGECHKNGCRGSGRNFC